MKRVRVFRVWPLPWWLVFRGRTYIGSVATRERGVYVAFRFGRAIESDHTLDGAVEAFSRYP